MANDSNNTDINTQIVLNPNYDYYKSVNAFLNPSDELNSLNYSNDIYYSYFYTSITWTETQVIVSNEREGRTYTNSVWTSAVTYGESKRNDLSSVNFWAQKNISTNDSNIYFRMLKQISPSVSGEQPQNNDRT